MSDIKYKPYVKFYFTDPTADLNNVEEIYTGNGTVQAVDADLGVFFGDCVNTGYGQIAYLDFAIERNKITENIQGLRAAITNPIGFLWLRVMDKEDLFDTGTSLFDFAGVIRRATISRGSETSDYNFYFEVARTRNRDFFDLRKAIPDPFDYQ